MINALGYILLMFAALIGIGVLIYVIILISSKIFQEVFEEGEFLVVWICGVLVVIFLTLTMGLLVRSSTNGYNVWQNLGLFDDMSNGEIRLVFILVTTVSTFLAFWAIYSQYLVFTFERIKFALVATVLLTPWYLVFLL